MSASLVGSEMCIRDSDGLAPVCLAAQRGRRDVVACSGGMLFFCVGCACPVSYTHLTLPTICSV
eukprot:6360301-Alexandrium_andersonii.AAC.1